MVRIQQMSDGLLQKVCTVDNCMHYLMGLQFWPIFQTFCQFWGKIFCSKSAETKILLGNVDMGIKLYLIFFFDLCSQKFELML